MPNLTNEMHRRELLRRTAMAAGVAGAAVLARADAVRAQAQPKQSKAQAGYQDRPNGTQRCGLCAHFQPPAGCEIVQGPISPDGWCRNFSPRA